VSDRTLSIDWVDDGVACLRIASDEAPYAEDWFAPALESAVEKLKEDEGLRAVVLEGGERTFSAGASRELLLSREEATVVWRYAPAIARAILSIPVPSVAAMGGHALGGGFILGLWCDVVVMAEESLYGANFITLGITPGMGSTAILEEAVGAPLARELLFTGRLLKGRELKAACGGIAHAIIPRAEVRGRALAIAREMAQAPREALVLLKAALAGRRRAVFERAVHEEQEMHAMLFAREDTRARIEARYGRSLPPFPLPARGAGGGGGGKRAGGG